MANIEKVSEADFDKKTKAGLVLVDFYADWCGPCRMLGPILDKVAARMSGKATIYKLDIDHSSEIAKKFQVTSVPTLILFKNGSEHSRVVGVQDEDSLVDFMTDAQ